MLGTVHSTRKSFLEDLSLLILWQTKLAIIRSLLLIVDKKDLLLNSPFSKYRFFGGFGVVLACTIIGPTTSATTVSGLTTVTVAASVGTGGSGCGGDGGGCITGALIMAVER